MLLGELCVYETERKENCLNIKETICRGKRKREEKKEKKKEKSKKRGGLFLACIGRKRDMLPSSLVQTKCPMQKM